MAVTYLVPFALFFCLFSFQRDQEKLIGLDGIDNKDTCIVLCSST